LALATSGSAYLNAWLLFRGLKRERVFRPASGWIRLAGQMLFANVLMALVLILGVSEYNGWADWGWMNRALVLAALCCVGLLVYLAALLLTGLKPKKLLMRA